MLIHIFQRSQIVSAFTACVAVQLAVSVSGALSRSLVHSLSSAGNVHLTLLTMHATQQQLGVSRPRVRPHCVAVPNKASVGPFRTRAYLEEKQPGKAPTGTNQLEVLKSMSVVVADTGEPELVKKFKPVDCTTNPSLVYKAVQEAEYQPFLHQALKEARSIKGAADPNRPYSGVADVLSTIIGAEMLKIVPGRVSTEVDAHLSYDSKHTYDKAMRLMDLYSSRGIGPDRVYIKLASTWEGVEACRKLQRQGVDCNMTLLFSFGQAAACADAGAALISPFVGRIMDWYKAKHNRDYAPHEDPGVESVKRIYTYYKTHGYNTIVMAASFRNKGEITELAGCDKITISPQLLSELQSSNEPLPRKLSPDMTHSQDSKVGSFSSEVFNSLHGGDQMAVDKLKQGIEGFAADQKKLEEQLAKLAAELKH